MFRHIVINKNKQPKHPKVTDQDYLYTERQASNDLFSRISVSEMHHYDNINNMRHTFKRNNKRIKALYAAKDPSDRITSLASMRLAS